MSRNDDAARARQDAFLDDLIPLATERLAERLAEDFDARAGQARFEAWLAANTREPAIAAENRAALHVYRARSPRRLYGSVRSLGLIAMDMTSRTCREILHRPGCIGAALVAAAIGSAAFFIRATALSPTISTLITLFASLVTWLCVSARWRRVQEDLLTKIASLQDEAVRARVRTAQVIQASPEWNAGYKQGCSDMLKAMAAMHGGGAGDQQPPESTTHTK